MATTVKSLETQPEITPSGWMANFRHTMGNALIITRREVRDSFRDWRIIGPIIILTFFFPFLAQDVAGRFTGFLEGYGAQLIGDRTIPFLLMIVGFFPISISLVIALETFVGEKERRSLEPLLSTPLSNTELYIGKTLAAMIPPLLSSFGGMAVYLSTLLYGELAWRPQPMLIVQVVLLTTVQALVMVTGAVVVSSQTTSTRAANLLASFIIVPMTLIINGESVIMFLAPDAESPRGIGALWAIIVGMFIVVVLLLRVGNSIFNREELLGRTIDSINLRGTFGKIWRYARAVDAEGTPAQNLLQWYRKGIPLSLSNLGNAKWITVGVFIAATLIGFLVGQMPGWQLPPAVAASSEVSLSNLSTYLGMIAQGENIAFFILQNSQVLFGATLLAMFSFGVGALVLTPITFGVLGYLLSQVGVLGFGLPPLLAAILPHGVIEIPVIVIATAAALKLGAVVTRPPRGVGVGHAWLTSFGDTLKLWLGLVLPGLLIAALLETFVTPAVVALLVR